MGEVFLSDETVKQIVEAVLLRMEVIHPITGMKIDWSRQVKLEAGALEGIKANLEKILSKKGKP